MVTKPCSGQVWIARCDSARSTVPVTPCDSNGWKLSPTMFIAEASARRTHRARSDAERVISAVSAAQPYHSPSRWMPSIFSPGAASRLRRVAKTLNSLLLPKISAWAIILPLCRSVPHSVRAPLPALPIPLPKAMTASLSVPHPASKTHQPPPDTRLLADAIRALAMDAVQAANSGHPGMPMGMAEIAVALWNRHLPHNPANPHWPDRDRFVLSNGHGSMLQYALLHLTGYHLPVEELKNFRQLHSKTPGHPEVGVTPGVETTTGPLGQGIANAVGMALAEKLLATEFNRDGHEIVDHHTYTFMGDGCMMEGIGHEACGLAGAWKLGKLIAIYDD